MHRLRKAFFHDIGSQFPRALNTPTASLAWALIVESALLNQRLTQDMREAANLKGCGCSMPGVHQFFLPNPSLEARLAFNEYVACRWPVHVFALDPVTQDQNIADIYSRRREMQMALAVGVAQGTVSARLAMRYQRMLETGMETIALNRTAIAFSHGSDTFGWRFSPRLQSPPAPGAVKAFFETLTGGPTTEQDLCSRRLEPGMRECVAVVLMPSFVPYCTFESRGSWFRLTNPRAIELTMHDAMKLSRIYAGVDRSLSTAQVNHCYRPVDVAMLRRVAYQMGQRLPLQSLQVQIPYENTLGGFELFSTGVTDLGPELDGWYGAPGIRAPEKPPEGCADCGVMYGDVAYTFPLAVGSNGTFSAEQLGGRYEQCHGTCNGTTLFLVGDRFSVHDTKVIVGGKCVPYLLLSRQLMQVTVPYDVNTIEHGGERVVDVHVATPYGVTGHLIVPVIPEKKKVATPKPDFAWNAKAVTAGADFKPKEVAGRSLIQAFALREKLPYIKINLNWPQSDFPKRAELLVQLVAADGKPFEWIQPIWVELRECDQYHVEHPSRFDKFALETLQEAGLSAPATLTAKAYLRFSRNSRFPNNVIAVGGGLSIKLEQVTVCPDCSSKPSLSATPGGGQPTQAKALPSIERLPPPGPPGTLTVPGINDGARRYPTVPFRPSYRVGRAPAR